MFRHIAPALAFLLAGGIAAAQPLTGRVTDRAAGIPLAGATVFVPELQKGAVSGTDGTFALELPGKGSVTVQVTMVGYRSFVVHVNLASPREPLAVALEPSLTQLEEVVITSSSSRLPDDVPYTVRTVTGDALQDNAAPTLMMKLATLPGIDRISFGNGIGKPVVRGHSFNRILLYAMGTRIENQQWDDRHDLGITDAGIDKVEIVQGPAALVYGADATGGALVFHDVNPLPADSTSGFARIGFSYNNFGSLAEGGIRHTGSRGWFYAVHAGGHASGSYVQGGPAPEDGVFKTNYAANSKYVDGAAKASAGVSRTWGTARLTYRYLNQRLGIVELEPDSVLLTEPEEEQRTYDVEAPFQQVQSHILSSENVFLLKKSDIRFNAAYQYNDRKEYEPVPGVKKGKEERVGLRLHVGTYDLKWTSDAAARTGITIGTQGMVQHNRNTGKEALVPDADVSDFAGYVLGRYDAGRWNFLAGARYDVRRITSAAPDAAEDSLAGRLDFTHDYMPVSASAGLAFHPAGGVTLKLNGATGFSAPNYAELGTYGRHEGTFRFEIGDDALRMQQNLEGDFGVLYEHKYVSFDVAAYYNKITDYLYIRPTADTIEGLQVYVFSQADASMYGGEAGVDLRFPGLSWLALKADYAFGRGTLDAGGDLPYMPADKIVSSVTLRPARRILLRNPFLAVIVSRYFAQPRVAAFEMPTGGYTLVDVQAGGAFTWLKHDTRLFVYGTNILDEAYMSHLSLVKNIGIGEMGRNFGFRMTMSF